MANVLVRMGMGLFMAATLAGCAASPPDEYWPQARPLGRDVSVAKPPPAPRQAVADKTQPPAPLQAGQVLSLRDAIALALMHNPSLMVYGWEIRAAKARMLQAGLRPNPELEVELESLAGSGPFAGTGAMETTVALSQVVELGGDRAARIHAARAARDLAGWDYESQRLNVLTDTTRRYVAVLAAQRRLELAKETLGLVNQTFATISRQTDAGEASPLERTRFSVQVATATAARAQAARQLAGARQRLAACWGQTAAIFGPLTGRLSEISPLPPLSQLTDLLEQNPQLARYAALLAHARAQTHLARAQASPDLKLGVGVQYFNDSDDLAAVIRASVPLPLFDRKQGDILAGRIQGVQAQQKWEVTRLELHTELAAQYQEAAGAYEQAVTLRDEILPAARAAFEGVQTAFRRGEVSLVNVLDAQRTLIDSENEYVDALAEYHREVAMLEGLTCQKLTRNRPRGQTPDFRNPSTTQQEQQ